MKSPSTEDQTWVTMRMSSVAMVMTLTEEGRPPLERFDTVPAVEMIVPLRVCSTKWMAS